ncbi:MAG: hypothetical protein WA609_11510 [Terriglobales bacterium]
MEKHEHDEDIERYLRKFQPREVRPLERPRRMERRHLRWLPVAAIVVFAGCVALWYGARQTSNPPAPRAISGDASNGVRPQVRMNTLALTKLALDDSKAFDAVLADESQAMFPNMRGKQSALRVLAKE